MPKFKIQHITKYTYEVPVRDSANQIMLYPITDDNQGIILHNLLVTGNPLIEIHTDFFNNKVGTFTHSKPHQELIIDSVLEVITTSKILPNDKESTSIQWLELEKVKHQLPYIDFLKLEAFQALPEMKKIMTDIQHASNTPLATATDFCAYVFNNFLYQKGITTVETTLDEIWNLKSGVCQDFAHILLGMLRLVNIPARYVSGYICPNKNGMRGEGATHAWVEAYIPFYGWLGLDPTNNCITNETHVRLAVGKNFSDCSPVKGTYRGTSNHVLEVAVSVSYENEETVSSESEIVDEQKNTSVSKNSFRRHQEIQMQQ
jgi:transglutaminase-like putative cysteine protease